ncbi:YcaO-like family protein [Paenarthrobacter nitroguajacolicus]|uniref:YcaO-like family protein n=1 Tax=Paenarthrobacter nitroguajacolicus TaxID=211146 RepID=UPI003417F95D
MSIDAARTLDPALGLVSEASTYLPNEVGLWRTVGLLANAGTGVSGFASAVGAFDVNRRASITRGAGEAVERFALVPADVDCDYLLMAHLQGADTASQRIDYVTPGLGMASALAYELPWYAATDLLTGKEACVPAPVVDYGGGILNPWDAFFDPSPNGAASGPSEAFAKASGVAEVIERDAFLVAWRTRTALQLFHDGGIPDPLRGTQETQRLLGLLYAAHARGISPTLAFIPSEERPLHTAVCIIIGKPDDGGAHQRQFGAVGIKAASDPMAALRGALQEGLQIRELFLARTPSVMPALEVTDDESRAGYWTRPEAIAELSEWALSFRASEFPRVKAAADVDTLVEWLGRGGIPSYWVSLTHRLPPAIQELGWVTGKAVCPGAIPLTMDETKGLARMPGGSSTTPHPLI